MQRAKSAVRRWFWRHVRRYRYELCHRCGGPVSPNIGGEPITCWHAPGDLWNEVEGGPGGVRCPGCFTRDAEAKGIPIRWEAVRGV